MVEQSWRLQAPRRGSAGPTSVNIRRHFMREIAAPPAEAAVAAPVSPSGGAAAGAAAATPPRQATTGGSAVVPIEPKDSPSSHLMASRSRMLLERADIDEAMVAPVRAFLDLPSALAAAPVDDIVGALAEALRRDEEAANADETDASALRFSGAKDAAKPRARSATATPSAAIDVPMHYLRSTLGKLAPAPPAPAAPPDTAAPPLADSSFVTYAADAPPPPPVAPPPAHAVAAAPEPPDAVAAPPAAGFANDGSFLEQARRALEASKKEGG